MHLYDFVRNKEVKGKERKLKIEVQVLYCTTNVRGEHILGRKKITISRSLNM